MMPIRALAIVFNLAIFVPGAALTYTALSSPWLTGGELQDAPTPTPEVVTATVDSAVVLPSESKSASERSVANSIAVSRLEGILVGIDARIKETADYSSRILGLFGLLSGLVTAAVGIGLWHSRNYLDRVIEGKGAELEQAIKKFADGEKVSISASVDELRIHVQEIVATQKSALEEIQRYRTEAAASANIATESWGGQAIASELPILLSLQEVVEEALDSLVDAGILSVQLRQEAMGRVSEAVRRRSEILSALAKLRSSEADTVMLGAHSLAGLGAKEATPVIAVVKMRWADDLTVTSSLEDVLQILEELAARA